MRSVVVLVLMMGVAVADDAGVKDASVPDAAPATGPEWTEGHWVYVHKGVQPPKDYEKPADACKAWSKFNKNATDTYVSWKPGKDDYNVTCVFNRKGGTPPQWDQEDLVKRELRCSPMRTWRPIKNDGKLESQKCHCDACPVPEPQNYCAPKTVPAPAHAPLTQAEADAQSVSQKMYAAGSSQSISTPYNAAKLEYDREKDKCPYQDFDDKDLCAPPNDVVIGTLCGSSKSDFDAANALAGYKSTPKGCTWHHHEDLGRMQLVKVSAHKAKGHAGGVAVWQKAFCTNYKGNPTDENAAQCEGYAKERTTNACSTAAKPTTKKK